MASRPIDVRLWMDLSTSSQIIPSASETQRDSIASMDDIRAVDTPEEIFNEQEGLAPSHIIPVRLAIIFLIAAQTSV